jgi:pilus assembly protein Flp/PilA
VLPLNLNLSRTRNWLKDECGQDLIEYALLAGLISVATVATLNPIASAISKVFSEVVSGLTVGVPIAT